MNLSLSQRFRFGAGIAICAIVILGLVSVYYLQEINDEIQTFLEGEYQILAHYDQTVARLEQLQTHQLGIFQTFDPATYAALLSDLRAFERKLTEDRTAIPEFAEVHGVILGQLAAYRTSLQMLQTGSEARRLDIFVQISLQHQLIQKELSRLDGIKQQAFRQRRTFISRRSRNAQSRMGIITFVTLSLGMVLWVFFSRKLSLPFRKIYDMIHRIRDGDYAVRAPENVTDEFAQLAGAIEQMIRFIRERDNIKVERIIMEKDRFRSLANMLEVPVMVLNEDNRIAFANNTFLELFRLGYDDIFFCDLSKAQMLVPELRSYLLEKLRTADWPSDQPLEIVGNNYAFDLKVTLHPVTDGKGKRVSVLCVLGHIDCSRAAGVTETKVVEGGKS